jgi:hypothetical protein
MPMPMLGSNSDSDSDSGSEPESESGSESESESGSDSCVGLGDRAEVGGGSKLAGVEWWLPELCGGHHHSPVALGAQVGSPDHGSRAASTPQPVTA